MTVMVPLIGVPAPSEEGRRYALNQSYVEAIRRCGGAVVLIPAAGGVEALRSPYLALAGLLLAGGGDVAPQRYGQPDGGKVFEVNPERDEAEILLTRWALEDNLPLLAICRGVQVLNVALGGTLVQDIPSQVPGALVHHPGTGAPRAWPQHPVRLLAGSRLAAALGRGRAGGTIEVNSFHHQAVETVAPALRAVASAPDGIIEGLEHPDRAFVLGVQWHPEEMVATAPAQEALFRAFVAACAGRRG